jgi:4-diphosphocytidyl-2-C-methyl-D-erythritol kinase
MEVFPPQALLKTLFTTCSDNILLMVVFPNAKINLGLHITGKRNDGYHDIESCFYPLTWSDILEVVESKNLSFTTTGIPIPGGWEDNLCMKAYTLLKNAFQLPPVSFHLHKIIPIGAGLGGGSADGAFALKAINEMFGLNLNSAQLEKYALQLGSDCPFFINNKPVFVRGRGEVFESIGINLKGKFILLVNPLFHVSTAEAYGGVTSYSKAGALKKILENSPIESWRGRIKNDFEDPVFQKYPGISSTKDVLYEKGALYASMTGSGASVYGIFEERVNYKGWFPAEYRVWQEEM